MTKSTKLLGGVASLALGCALAAGAPVFAQSLSQSSPEEMAQTMMLNDEELGRGGMPGQTETIIVSNETSNQSAYSAAQMQFDQAQARYKQQVDEYNKELNDYRSQNQSFEQQASNFNAAAGDYNATVSTPPPVVSAAPPSDVVIETTPNVVVENPPVVVAQGSTLVYPDATTLVHLGSLPQPDIDIAGAPVEDRFHRAIGHFNHMTYVDEGQEKALIVLNNNKMVAVPEDHVRFDPDHSVVVADLSFDELNRLPGRL